VGISRRGPNKRTNLAEAQASLGIIITAYDWNWAEAEKEFKKAA